MSNLFELKCAEDLRDMAFILGFTPKGLSYVLNQKNIQPILALGFTPKGLSYVLASAGDCGTANLGFTPKGLSYVLYMQEHIKKYSEFEIPKKNGGSRTILAPEPRLKLLQKRLANLLYECVEEIKKEHKSYGRAAHGFVKDRTIVSNAKKHRGRRYVFNIDIEDFFGTINFGRVRGLFINDRHFKLHPAVATIIAQIACHKNALPQGSPCSPIISNLIGHIVDRRLSVLARKVKCTYTRYADDITFSTNMKVFPAEIATMSAGKNWQVGDDLKTEIQRSGFSLNEDKTRMSLHCSRQTVTGLVVNVKPNISQDYYRNVRAMCHSLFMKGQYHRSAFGNAADKEDREIITSLAPLEGMLSYIYFVKMRRDRRDDKKSENSRINKRAENIGEFVPPKAIAELYKRFLYYKHFAASSEPLIVCEGKTDITYLKCAICALADDFPTLAETEDGQVRRKVRFLKRSDSILTAIGINEGTSGQAQLIGGYKKMMGRFKHKPMDSAVIILCDNDEGAKSVFSVTQKNSDLTVSLRTDDPFYHIIENLYLIKIPEDTEKGIPEYLFDKDVLEKKLDGECCEILVNKDDKDTPKYSKHIFAEKVIRANQKNIRFTGFKPLLERINACISDYEAVKAGKGKDSDEAAAE